MRTLSESLLITPLEQHTQDVYGYLEQHWRGWNQLHFITSVANDHMQPAGEILVERCLQAGWRDGSSCKNHESAVLLRDHLRARQAVLDNTAPFPAPAEDIAAHYRADPQWRQIRNWLGRLEERYRGKLASGWQEAPAARHLLQSLVPQFTGLHALQPRSFCPSVQPYPSKISVYTTLGSELIDHQISTFKGFDYGEYESVTLPEQLTQPYVQLAFTEHNQVPVMTLVAAVFHYGLVLKQFTQFYETEQKLADFRDDNLATG